MSVEVFEIEVNKFQNRTYFHPGEKITGKIIILVKNPVYIEEFSLNFIGGCKIKIPIDGKELKLKRSESLGFFNKIRNSFRSRSQMLPASPSSLFTNNDYYEEQFKTLTKNFTPEDPTCIPPNRILVNSFSFVIPEYEFYPPTIEERLGNISYKFEIRLILKNERIIKDVPIILHQKLPLQNIPFINKHCFMLKYKKGGIFGIFSGKTGFRVRLEKKGFIPGEIIGFGAELVNTSRVTIITSFHLALVKKTIYNLKGKIREEITEIGRIYGPTLNDKKRIEYWSSCNFLIPENTFPTLNGTFAINKSPIEFEYFISAEMKILNISEPLKESVSIIIGTL